MKHSSVWKGFTLIELLIAVAIIGVLSVVGMNTYTGILRDARDARRREELKQLQTALEAYKAANSVYPSTGGAWYTSDPGDTAYSYNGGNYIPNPAGLPVFVPTYMRSLPRDPKGGNSTIYIPGGPDCRQRKRAYLYRSNGTDYKLMSHCAPEGKLNNPSDSFYDPRYPNHAWQVSSSATSIMW
jgi:prepilin-type N-terminal cleavage/methylation domain-containing protein